MRNRMFPLKLIALAMGLSLGVKQAKAQFVPNGDFQSPGFIPFNNNCPSISNWTFGGPGVPEYAQSGSNFWLDLTVCDPTRQRGFGDGVWIEQTVTTVPGKLYYLQMDLGTWNGWWSFDAGVDIEINGVPLNAGPTRVFNNVFSATQNPNWATKNSCLFQATGTSTHIRIIGNGENPQNPGYSNPSLSPTPQPGIIAIDNVKLLSVSMSHTTSPCNQACFSLNTGALTAINVKWYVDNELRATGPNFCWKLPKAIQKEVKATFSIVNGCGQTYTITQMASGNQDCPCTLQESTSLIPHRINCSDYYFELQFSAGNVSKFTDWTIDGEGVVGTNGGLVLNGLSPGSHEVCATMIGGVEGDLGKYCCAKVCTTVVVPGPPVLLTKIVYYCPLGMVMTLPVYNPCNENDCYGDAWEFWSNGQLIATSNDPCFDIPVSGNCEIRCFDVLTGGPMLPDGTAIPAGTKCLKKTVRLVPVEMPVTIDSSPAEMTYILPCAQTTMPYQIPCSAPDYTDYELAISGSPFANGSLLNGPVVLDLMTGTYDLKCYNKSTCKVQMHRFHITPMPVSSSTCVVSDVESCALPDAEPVDPEIITRIAQSCPDCAKTVEHASSMGPWQQISYDPDQANGLRIVGREYSDASNCTKCYVLYQITGTDLEPFPNQFRTLYTGENPCTELTIDGLPECMKNKNIKGYIEGKRDETLKDYPFTPGTATSLCCDGEKTIYHFYSEEDPCCWAVVSIVCDFPMLKSGGAGSETVSPKVPGQSGLMLIPNPTASVFRISSEKGYDMYKKVEISDVNGKTVFVKTEIDSKTELDVSGLTKGTYFVTVTTVTGNVTLKLIRTGE